MVISKRIGSLFLVVCAALYYLLHLFEFRDEIYFMKLTNLTEEEEVLSRTFINYSNRKCNYITFNYMGQTGNQMFMYASFFVLAKKNDKIPFIQHRDFPLLKDFKISTPTFNISYFNQSTFVVVPDPGAYRFEDYVFKLACKQNYTVGGFRLSWKYFANYAEEIKKEFQFVDSISTRCDKILEDLTVENNITRSNCILVGAHMRRGDFVKPDKLEFGHVPASREYLYKAIDFFESKHSNNSCLAFIVVGNDYEWNIQNSPNKSNVFVLKPYTPTVDLCVLSRCNHTIISSGSFGWWAAYLANGEATYMAKQCRPNSLLCSYFDLNSYINPTWNWYPIK